MKILNNPDAILIPAVDQKGRAKLCPYCLDQDRQSILKEDAVIPECERFWMQAYGTTEVYRCRKCSYSYPESRGEKEDLEPVEAQLGVPQSLINGRSKHSGPE